MSVAFAAQPRWLLLLESVAGIGAVGFVDYSTGSELSVAVLYAVPVFAAAWYIDRSHGVGVAALGGGTWWLANLFDHPYRTQHGHHIAAITRLAYFIFVAIGASALRSQREVNRQRIAALERTRMLEAEIVRISEREQQRIGRDLHDGLCQRLAEITLAAKALADDLTAKGLPAAVDAREIESLLNDGITHTRSLACGLLPVHAGESGLCRALEELASMTQRLSRRAVVFEACGDVMLADAGVITQLYRIAQEALSNALKHGDAQRVVIGLNQADATVVLTVADEGRGYADSGIRHPGIGLASMRCRAHSIGADLRIEPRAGGGTILTCTYPTHQVHSPDLLCSAERS